MKAIKLILCLLLALNSLSVWAQKVKPVMTPLHQPSGIDTIVLTKQNSTYLALLGQTWGFLKYHHPAIAKGKYDWDAELFKVMPEVLKAGNNAEFSAVLQNWVNGLGKIKPCPSCKIDQKTTDRHLLPDYGDLFTNTIFSAALTTQLRYIKDNANNKKHHYVHQMSAGNASFDNENSYPHTRYPDAGIRLLALYRLWSMVQYFSPNRNLTAQSWNRTLEDYIPELIHAENKIGYALVMAKLISSLKDTHSVIGSDVFQKWLGKYALPFDARFVEGQLVVTSYIKDTLDVKNNMHIGDIITHINGEGISGLIRKYEPIVSASNYETTLRDMPVLYLLRNNDQQFKLQVIRDEKVLELTQQGVENTKLRFNRFAAKRGAVVYQLLRQEVGYIAANSFKVSQMKNIKKEFKTTKGIIVDMRGYPSDFMIPSLVKYFKASSSAFVNLSGPSIAHPGMFINKPIYNGGSGKNSYKGKVVVIVNEFTQSNAEYVTMAMNAADRTTIIGSTSAGADGNISLIKLPGGIFTYISGLGVCYPDGTDAQRKGVKINTLIKPTINGIKQGKDELLETAQAIILENE